jgi:hypothetical protein
MAFSLSLGGAYKTVATQEQVEGLVAQGWVLASGGTADDTTALGEFPSYLEDFCGASPNPSFRGTGFNGELQTNLGYLIKKAQPELSKSDYDAILDAFYNDELKTASTFTNIVVVSEIPEEPDEVTIYLLKDGDGDPVDGLYTYNDGHVVAYTPGTAFNPNYGAEQKLALLSTYTSSAAFAALPIATDNTKTAIETILLAALQTVVNEGEAKAYTVSFVSSAYVTETGVWTGKYKVVKDDDAADTATDAVARTLRFGAFVAMKLITDVAIETVPDDTLNTQTAVRAAVLAAANTAIAEMTGYVATWSTAATYSDTARTLTGGKITVTETANAAVNVFVDASARSLDIIPVTAFASATKLAAISDADLLTVPNGTEDTLVGVSAAMILNAQTDTGAGFTATWEAGATYDTGTNAFVGKLRITKSTIPLDFAIDATNRSFTVIIAES